MKDITKFFLEPNTTGVDKDLIARTNEQRVALCTLIGTCLAAYMDREVLPFSYRCSPTYQSNWFEITFDMNLKNRTQFFKIARVRYEVEKTESGMLKEDGFVEFIIPDEFSDKQSYIDNEGDEMRYTLTKDGFRGGECEELLKYRDPKILLHNFNWKKVRIPLRDFLTQEYTDFVNKTLKNWSYVSKLMKNVMTWDLEKTSTELAKIRDEINALQERRRNMIQAVGKKFGMVGRTLPMQGLPTVPEEDYDDGDENAPKWQFKIENTYVMD